MIAYGVQCLGLLLQSVTHRRARGTIASPAGACTEAWQSVWCSSRQQSVHAVVLSGRIELRKSVTSGFLKVENCSGVEFADLRWFVPKVHLICGSLFICLKL